GRAEAGTAGHGRARGLEGRQLRVDVRAGRAACAGGARAEVTDAPIPDAWDPETYELFKRERAEPFEALLALAKQGPFARGVDLGGGPGGVAASEQERLRGASMLGIDSSPAMVAQAARHAGPGLTFAPGDLAAWTGDHDHDLVLSNAALQWAEDHRAVL